jgi:hypothetical protein
MFVESSLPGINVTAFSWLKGFIQIMFEYSREMGKQVEKGN